METEVHFHNDVSEAVAMALRGKVGEAERHLERRSGDVFSLVGIALVKSVQALLSEDSVDVATAFVSREAARHAMAGEKRPVNVWAREANASF